MYKPSPDPVKQPDLMQGLLLRMDLEGIFNFGEPKLTRLWSYLNTFCTMDNYAF